LFFIKSNYTIVIMRLKTILLTSIIITSSFLINYETALAVNIGQPCPNTDYCNIGDVCIPDPITHKGICQPGPDDCKITQCGNGYLCDVTSKLCKQDYSGGVPIGSVFQNNFKSAELPTIFGVFISSLLGQIYIVSLILVLFYIIWGAYRYMLSGGDAQKTINARKHILWGVVGEIIIYVSYGLFQLVNHLLGTVY
jgi:hypothetical protein